MYVKYIVIFHDMLRDSIESHFIIFCIATLLPNNISFSIAWFPDLVQRLVFPSTNYKVNPAFRNLGLFRFPDKQVGKQTLNILLI
jgi:hypothetical protein